MRVSGPIGTGCEHLQGWLACSLSLFPHFLCPFLFACVGLILSCCRPAPSAWGRGNLGAASFGPHFCQLPPPEKGWPAPLGLVLFKSLERNMIGLSGIRCSQAGQSTCLEQQSHTTGGTSLRLGMSKEASSWVDHIWLPIGFLILEDHLCHGFVSCTISSVFTSTQVAIITPINRSEN